MLFQELFNTSVITIMYVVAFIVQLAVWTPPYSYFRASNLTAGVSLHSFSYHPEIFYFIPIEKFLK